MPFGLNQPLCDARNSSDFRMPSSTKSILTKSEFFVSGTTKSILATAWEDKQNSTTLPVSDQPHLNSTQNFQLRQHKLPIKPYLPTPLVQPLNAPPVVGGIDPEAKGTPMSRTRSIS